METIQRQIKLATTTGTTVNASGGTEVIIIPDISVTYQLQLLLTGRKLDFGFFDAYIEPVEPPAPPPATQYVDSDNDIFVDSNNDIFIE